MIKNKVEMRNLKFLILVMGLLAAHGIMAVTLPGTSYTPAYFDTDSYEPPTVSPYGVTLPSSSFLGLGASVDDCVEKGTFSLCEDCCGAEEDKCFQKCADDDDACFERCKAATAECKNACGRSLPLDAPLWCLLLPIVILSASKNLFRHSLKLI